MSIFELNPILSTLLESGPSVITAITGSILTAIFLRRDTSTKEFEKIKACTFNEVIQNLLAEGKMTYTEFYKAKNFLSIAKKADEFYSKSSNSKKTTNEYDFDWFINFYESVGNVSNEKMQEIWAKMLSEEAKYPSSFSIKTIDILKNMNKNDAVLFDKICKYSIVDLNNNCFVPRYDEYTEAVGIRYSEIMQLYELGLLYINNNIEYTIPLQIQKSIIFVNGELAIMAEAKNKQDKIKIDQYPFTKAGNELARINGNNIENNDYIIFAKTIKNKNKNATIELRKIIREDENVYSCDSNDLLSNARENNN